MNEGLTNDKAAIFAIVLAFHLSFALLAVAVWLSE